MDELLQKLPYWNSLTDSEKQAVARAAVLRHCQPGNLLHGRCDGGESCLGMIYLVSGEVRTYILSEGGREITLFRIAAGESCVLSASCVFSQSSLETQITVTKEADILIVPAAAFRRLTENNIYVRCFMYELATARFSTVMWVMQQILFLRFDQRLAAYLLEEYRRSGSTELRMTQEQLAQNVNSAREVVARMLKQFASDGLIENRRGVIVLKSISGLEQIKN